MKPTRQVVPLSILWEDGREFFIDRILSVKPAPSIGGGSGVRYEIRILNKIKYIYLDDYVWFVDA